MRRSGAEVLVFRDADALAQAASDAFISSATAAIGARGRFAVALSGGSTPKGLYAVLATPRFASRVPWDRVHVFWSDERCVPPDDPGSNYGMVRETLLARVPILAEHVHRIRGEDDPAAAAGACEREMRDLFRTPEGHPRLDDGARFDLILLGMGADGHTASLFPGTSAVRETRSWAVAQSVTSRPAWRVTLTPPVLNAAAEVMMLVSGREKAATLRRVLDGPHEPEVLPAQIVAPGRGRLRFFVDQAAAGVPRE